MFGFFYRFWFCYIPGLLFSGEFSRWHCYIILQLKSSCIHRDFLVCRSYNVKTASSISIHPKYVSTSSLPSSHNINPSTSPSPSPSTPSTLFSLFYKVPVERYGTNLIRLPLPHALSISPSLMTIHSDKQDKQDSQNMEGKENAVYSKSQLWSGV